MLEDRDYMRQPSYGLNWSATMMLLAINAAVFLLTYVVPVIPENYLVLSLYGMKHGYVWQLVTFQFLHAGWLHIIFNSLALFFFGRPVEIVLGRWRFLQLYFAAGILGGLLQMLLAAFIPQFFGTMVVGASAGVAGLIAAFAVMNWENRFTLLIYFFPVAMRGKTLFWGSIVLALLGPLYDRQVAHAAHLGGILTGFAFIKWGLALGEGAWNWRPFRRRQRKRELVRAASLKAPRWPLSKGAANIEPPPEEFISREVDPILDKISAHGIQSLTERERRILEAARAKMAKR